jgi:hypothetical protein
MDTATLKTPLAKLQAAARKDPKKAGVLSVLVLVMAGLWVKVLVHPAPKSAAAGTPAAAASRGQGGRATASAARRPAPADNTGRFPSAQRTSWTTVRLAPAGRNLFAIDYDRFEKSGKSTASGAPVQQTGDSAADLAKSGPSQADLNKERQILVANLQTQAAGLKLQTTVMGPSPKALVNGTLVGEGDSVASFRVVKITPRGMVIEREGIKLEVQMK